MNRRLVVAMSAAGVASAALTAVAAAFWTAPGGGTGSAATASGLAGVTVQAAGVAPGSALLPGGSAEVVLRIANSNSFPVTVTSVSPLGGTPVSAANGCAPTGVTFTAQTGAWVVPAGSSGTVVRLAGAGRMDTTSASACQGTTFAIPVTVTARR